MERKFCHPVFSMESLERAWETVKRKNTAGGIDDITIVEYDSHHAQRLLKLQESLYGGRWKPNPYLNIGIPKKDNEVRTIGLLSVEDKIVQTAIKQVMEPYLERTFYPSSYAYRPGKGHVKCVKTAFEMSKRFCEGYYVRCDIDDFFDSVNRDILFNRLGAVFPDKYIVEMTRMCVEMGSVSADLSWHQREKGLPQGAVLSPLLANFYLSPFDQSMTSRCDAYLRYSDDIVYWSDSYEKAETVSQKLVEYLKSKLELTLNAEPEIISCSKPMEFLGLMISPSEISMTQDKINELEDKIYNIELYKGVPSKLYLRNIDGIKRYFLTVLPSKYKEVFSGILQNVYARWNENGIKVDNKTFADISSRILGAENDSVVPFVAEKTNELTISKKSIKEAVAQRKKEYHKLEAENSELVISGPGYFLGAGKSGLMLRKNGQPVRIRSAAVKHITIMSGGVGMSSNLIYYCQQKGISIDFFGEHNSHVASLLSPSFLHLSLWNRQALMEQPACMEFARSIMLGKLKNQANLCKYYNKYHKHKGIEYAFDDFMTGFTKVVIKVKQLPQSDDFESSLMAYEAQGAELYWEYIRELLYDDDVEFYSRVKQGAKDLINCMLNYGYGLLYPKVWQALLRHGLNPYVGFVHYVSNNPNLVFDFIELFRSQVVDRIVISMIQKKVKCSVDGDGRLSDETRNLLTERILERLYRYEPFRNEKRTMIDIIDIQAYELSRCIMDGQMFKPYVSKW